jgi:hypothetical protein
MQCPKFFKQPFLFLAFILAAFLCPVLTYAAPPVVTVPTSPVDAVIGEPVTLSVEVDSTHPLRYCWRKEGQILPGETGAKLKIKNVFPSTAGAYSVEVTNEHGTTMSEPINVRVCAPNLRIYNHNHSINLTFKARKCVRYTVECKNLLLEDGPWNSFATIENKNGTVRLTDHAAASHSLCVFRLKAEPACSRKAHCRHQHKTN